MSLHPSDPPHDPPARTVADAKWSCRTCGSCCRGFEFGPVEPEIIRGLIARGIEDHWEPASDGPWFESRPNADGESEFYLSTREEHCIFLRPDNLCAIHAAFGAEAKPAFCREYPFHLVDDARGTSVVARPDCGGFHKSFLDGQPVDEQLDEVLSLPSIRPRRRWNPSQVEILPGLAVSPTDWLALEEVLMEDLSATRRDPESSIARLRDQIARAAGRSLPPPDPRMHRLALGAALRSILAILNDGLAQQPPGYRRSLMAGVARDTGAALSRLNEPLPPLAGDGRDYLHLVLRTDLLSKQFQIVGSIPAGLGASLLGTSLARMAAPDRENTPLTAERLGVHLPRFRKVLKHRAMVEVLRRGRPYLVDLFLHAPHPPAPGGPS